MSDAARGAAAAGGDVGTLRGLLEALIRIDSVNPALDPARAGEGELARFVADWARARGLHVTWLEGTPGRPSVIVRSGDGVGGPARGGGRVLLNAHLDTVGVAGMEAPFVPREVDGRTYARGAMDMKASLAACLRAVEAAAGEARAGRVAGEVILTAVADEEHDSLGTREALAALAPEGPVDVAVVTEPTDLTLHVAHRGFAVVDVTFAGRASHTSRPADGVNAVTHLGRLLHAVERANAALAAGPAHPLVGAGAWQAVLASGGRELFTTPDRATASLERRTVPGERAAGGGGAEDEVRAWLAALADDDPTVHAEVRTVVAREAFEAGDASPAAAHVAAAAEAVTGAAPERLGAPYWTDAALVADAGHPTVLYGPVGGGIHQPGEWVDLASVEVLEAVLGALVRRVAG